MACGIMALLVVAVWRSAIDRGARIATLLFGAGTIAWLISESAPLWGAMGDALPILLVAYPMGGFFWLFILSVFADRAIGWRTLLPAALLLASGIATAVAPRPWSVWVSISRDLFSIVLIAHAGLVIVRGWSGDMVESRRRLRSLVLGAAVLFGGFEMLVALQEGCIPWAPGCRSPSARCGARRRWTSWRSAWAGCSSAPARSCSVPPAGRSPEPTPASKPPTALELERLDAAMEAGAWRREGLTIGALAGEVSVPEHRLRRLINQRIGHRNFADFLNARRIEAAKQRLGDPRGGAHHRGGDRLRTGLRLAGPLQPRLPRRHRRQPHGMAPPGAGRGGCAGSARSRLNSKSAGISRRRRDFGRRATRLLGQHDQGDHHVPRARRPDPRMGLPASPPPSPLPALCGQHLALSCGSSLRIRSRTRKIRADTPGRRQLRRISRSPCAPSRSSPALISSSALDARAFYPLANIGATGDPAGSGRAWW